MQPYIKRSELLELLCRSSCHPLTLVVAPAGSGKSMLIEQWLAEIKSQAVRPIVISFALRPKYNHYNTLFTALFDQLKTNIPLWDASFFQLFKDDSEVDIDTVAELTISALEQASQPVYLVFDDFHTVSNEKTHQTIEKVLHGAPSNAHIVLSSRCHPAFSVVKLKLKGDALIIDSNDLRMNESEIASLNLSLGNQSLNHQQMAHILNQTEGWFVGTKLALLAYHKAGETGLRRFGGTQPELLDFFGHEVLRHLSHELKKFLMATAVCGEFNVEICEQVLDIPLSGNKLDELLIRELFVIRDSQREGWYRYHPLLQEFLLKKLTLEYGEDFIQLLHGKLARYYLQHQEPEMAIVHAKQSGNESFALTSIGDACRKWFKDGDVELLLDALSDISDKSLLDHSRLLLYKLGALCFTRRFNQASYYLQQLHELSTCPIDTQSARSLCKRQVLCGYARFFEYILNLFQSDAEVLSSSIMEQESFADTSEELEAFRQTVHAYALLCQGQLDNAFKLASIARITLQRLEHHLFESFANSIIILCDRYLGRGIEAVRLMQSVYQPVQEGKHTQRWMNLATGMMVVEYEQNNADRAEQLVKMLIPVINHACATEVVSMLYLHAARLTHSRGESSKAARMLDQLERILSLGKYPRFNSQVVHEKMRQAFLSSDAGACDKLYDLYNLEEIDEAFIRSTQERYSELTDRLALAKALWLIRKNKLSQAATLITALAQVLDRNKVKTRALIAHCHLAVLADLQGNHEIAIAQLRRTIRHYGLVCFSRTVFDETPGLSGLFNQAIATGSFSVPSLFEQTFASLLHNGKSAPVSRLMKGLTDKEQKILDLLSAGMSNAEISEKSDIALSTTKWHIKNIYLKLGVDNRAAAIKLAIQAQ